ncbi:DnaJ domain-containing protein [Besnoitia besnoiti]|uniref:DnaJ domain-containing protein n=1 Tax=Besnoitia besnoiti TaxID=94643 RepID=A0A2A9MJV3_BESBE|nr:DnaJ domain-containing protein [Besnoitia besnoiti]PFH35877.1 DnaJ domain-containing protein [Besnoitia besnoiti]
MREKPGAARRAGPSPYEVLGVAPNASRAEIRAAFFRAARLCHPDKHQQLQRWSERGGRDFEDDASTRCGSAGRGPATVGCSTDSNCGSPPALDAPADASARGIDKKDTNRAVASGESERARGAETDERRAEGACRRPSNGNAESTDSGMCRDFIALKEAFDALQVAETRQAVDQALLRQGVAHVTCIRLSDLQWLDDDLCFFVCRCGEELPLDARDLAARRRARRKCAAPACRGSADSADSQRAASSGAAAAGGDAGHADSGEGRNSSSRAEQAHSEAARGTETLDSEGKWAGCGKGDPRESNTRRPRGDAPAGDVLVEVSCESCSLTMCLLDGGEFRRGDFT